MQPLDDPVARLKARLKADREALRARHGGLVPIDPAPPAPCSLCKGAEWVKSREFDPQVSTVSEIEPCPKCKARSMNQAALDRFAASSGMEHARHIQFETVTPFTWQEEHWQAGLTYADYPEKWLWLTGGFSTGKTMLAYCIANYWMNAGKPVMYRIVPTFLRELRSTMDDDSPVRYGDLMKAVLDAQLLILDDYGQQVDTPWALETLFQITDHRLERRLSTVVATNLGMGDLERKNLRLFHRVSDQQRVLLVPFPDERPKESAS